MRKILYGGAMIGKAEKQAILRVVNKNYWPLAEEGRKMEIEAANFLGVKYGILANSGSSAGLLALSALELPKGSEVIISAVTFPTIFNIILQCGLMPVVVDAKLGTFNFDIGEVEKAITEKTKAIIAVHAVGNPCDMPALMRLVKGRGIYVLEDNCDGFGSAINGKKIGSFGDVSFTSFHAAHIVAMGQGGGVFTNNKEIAERVRMYRDWGRQANLEYRQNMKFPKLPLDQNPRFIYEKIGYNLSPLELQAAMGRIQLRKTNKIKKLRKRNFDYFYEHLSNYSELEMPRWIEGADVCWFAFPLSVKNNRGLLLNYLEKHGIETRTMFAGNITKHPAYEKSKYRISGDLNEADIILTHSFWIGVHPRMTEADRKYVVKVFDDYFTKECWNFLL